MSMTIVPLQFHPYAAARDQNERMRGRQEGTSYRRTISKKNDRRVVSQWWSIISRGTKDRLSLLLINGRTKMFKRRIEMNVQVLASRLEARPCWKVS